jgi:hypothetical protein
VIFTSGQNKGLAQAIKMSTQADGLILAAPLILHSADRRHVLCSSWL